MYAQRAEGANHPAASENPPLLATKTGAPIPFLRRLSSIVRLGLSAKLRKPAT